MMKQQELVRQVTGKNRLSNIMLCCKIVFDLIPQVLLIHMIGLYFAAALTREQILWECGAMLICFTERPSARTLQHGRPINSLYLPDGFAAANHPAFEKVVSRFLSGTKDGRSDKCCAA